MSPSSTTRVSGAGRHEHGRRRRRGRRGAGLVDALAEIRGQRVGVVDAGEAVLLRRVADAVGELVQAADVVDVGVAGEDDQRPLRPAQRIDNGGQRRDAVAGVNEEVRLPAPNKATGSPARTGGGTARSAARRPVRLFHVKTSRRPRRAAPRQRSCRHRQLELGGECGQRVAEDAGDLVDVGLRHDQRRADEDVVAEAAPAGAPRIDDQAAVVGEVDEALVGVEPRRQPVPSSWRRRRARRRAAAPCRGRRR